MLVLYVAYMLIYAGLWIRRVKPARVRMFLPLAFILPTALQFVFLIGRSSIEYAFPSESSGRKTGYLVLDMFWLLILGPTFTLATVLFPLHYVRYVVLVRLLRQQIQRSFDDHHRSVIEKSHHDHSIESPIELEPKEDDSPKMDSSNGLSVHKERLILWLRRLTSNRTFTILYLVLQVLLSSFYIVMLVLDYGLSVLPPRSSYTVGVYIQNSLGVIVALFITILFIVEWHIHLWQQFSATRRSSSILRVWSTFLFDSPFYFHIDAAFLISMIPVSCVSVIDRFTRFLPHPFLELVDILFQTLWLLSLGSAGAMIVFAIRHLRRKNHVAKDDDSSGDEEVASIPQKIIKCINDSRLRDKFEKHATREQCVENVWCIYAIQKWEALSMDQRKDFFHNFIHSNFVARGAVYEVNIGNEMRKLIETGDTDGMAALLRTAIENLRGVYMRFEQSTN